MKEYIDKELFLSSMGLAGDETKYGNRDAEHQHRSYSTYMAYEILDSVDDATAADVVERKRGRWLEIDGEVFECDMCHRIHTSYKYDFCPECGSDMRSPQNILCDQTEEVEPCTE